MRKSDFNGNHFWIERRKEQLSIAPEEYDVVLDRDMAKWLGELLCHFADTGRLTKRGK